MAKVNKSILVVGTYPIKNPSHGGQKRLDAIVTNYRTKFATVVYASVFYGGFYADYSATDIPLGRSGRMLVERSPMTGDIICGESIYSDATVKRKFTKLLISLKPDVIHIEQPFPYLGLKPLLKELGMSPSIVFGSQNIEAPMKREILALYKTPLELINKVENDIVVLEESLSQEADVVVACTPADLVVHKMMGAKRLVLAPNGVTEQAASAAGIKHWESEYAKAGVTKTAVFVASAHPPNWAGFKKMVGTALGFMPNDARIVGAGSISDLMTSEVKQDTLDIRDVTFWLRAMAAGRLSEDRLRSVIVKADVLLLPITEGGGSNLKTAEAIIADKKVVTTSHALRSFEWFKDFPNVWVADTPGQFRKAIVDALSATKMPRSARERQLAKDVLWSHCLKSMVQEVAAL